MVQDEEIEVVRVPGPELRKTFGDIDIYVFDQLLRGRFDQRTRILDAGCGQGRNLHYLLGAGFTCFGVDRDEHAIERVRSLAAALAPELAPGHFITGGLENLPWSDGVMDVVMCSAVLHFADDVAHWDQMVHELWRVLAPNGLLFTRLASNIGLEQTIGRAARRVRLPDGSDRFIVDEPMLMQKTAEFGGRLADPLKTTVVQGERAMTTWCVLKA